MDDTVSNFIIFFASACIGYALAELSRMAWKKFHTSK